MRINLALIVVSILLLIWLGIGFMVFGVHPLASLIYFAVTIGLFWLALRLEAATMSPRDFWRLVLTVISVK